MSEKRFVGGWWMWILLLVSVTLVVLGILRSIGMFTSTIVERKVFENSFQYSESRKSELAIWKKELMNIETLLRSPHITEKQKWDLQARKNALNIMIENANRQHNNIIMQ